MEHQPIIIPLSANAATRPIILDLAALQAWMIFPDDGKARERALLTSIQDYVVKNPQAREEVDVVANFDLFARATPIDDMQESLKGRIREGYFVGAYLHEELGAATRGERQTQDASIAYVLHGDPGKIGKKTPKRDFGDDAFKRAWKRLRRVSHLWAASATIGEPFPCPVNRLGEFLSRAEGYRTLAESTLRNTQNQSAILNPGEAVRFSIEIEPAALEFGSRPGG